MSIVLLVEQLILLLIMLLTNTMKKTLKATTLLLIAAALSISASYAFAAFSDPTDTAPNRNRDSVITDGETQLKNGSLSVDAFSAAGYSYFGQDVFFQGEIRGDSSAPTSFIRLGGTDSFGVTCKFCH